MRDPPQERDESGDEDEEHWICERERERENGKTVGFVILKKKKKRNV